ncbi:MAG: hypothetical protein WCI72_00930 [archaeon]
MEDPMTEEEVMFAKELEKAAAKEGISVEAMAIKLQRRDELLKAIPPTERLYYIEDLIKRGIVNPGMADITLRKNPIYPDEVKVISSAIRKELALYFGLDVPEYKLIFNKKLNEPLEAAANTNWADKTIIFPVRNGINLPWVIAHEHAHAYQMENSALYRKIRETSEREDLEEYQEIKMTSQRLSEGWATFLSLEYAKVRDARLGREMYGGQIRHSLVCSKLIDRLNGAEDKAPYYDGLEFFEKIYAKKGLAGTIYAANNLIRDKELVDFSVN